MAKKTTWRSKLDIHYLDETSLVKRHKQQLNGVEIGGKLLQFVDYASKESLGNVQPAGFLWKYAGFGPKGVFLSPSLLPNEERKRRIVKCWWQHLRTYGAPRGILQHRLVFSMSASFHNKLVKSGLNPETVLLQSVKKTMRKFQEKFHPRDSVGYAYGFHHDTDHLHIHVTLCPRTQEGKYVGCSGPLKGSKENRRNNQLGYLRDCCAQENRLWEKKLADPEAINQTVRHYIQQPQRPERYLIVPRPPGGGPERMKMIRSLRGKYERLVRLNAQIGELKQQRKLRFSSRVTRLLAGGISEQTHRTLEKADQLLQVSQLRSLQKQFCQLRSAYLGEYHDYRMVLAVPRQSFGPSHAVTRDISRGVRI